MEKIIVKLLENPANPKLKMKYVGAVEYATAKTGRDGKLITGVDENSIEFNSIEDPKKRDKIKKETEKERLELERLLNVELGPNSEFWNSFYIPMTDEEISLDPSNPMDRLKEKFLIANKYAAPSREAIDTDEDFQNCIFYLHREEEEIAKSVKNSMKADKAKAVLISLYEENPNKLKIVASYIFGYDAQIETSADNAYAKLREYIEEKDKDQQKKNIKLFTDVTEMTPEAISIKLTFDKAIKKRIVTQKGGIYRRNDIPLGNSYEEALKYLSSPEQSGEFDSLRKEVQKS